MEQKKVESSDLVLTRIFNAPRKLVFKVWADPAHFGNWWGPKGSSLKVSAMEVRPGGMFLRSHTSPDGEVMWGKFVYREVSPPEKLVFIQSFADEDGNTIRASFSPHWPLEILNTLTLTEEAGGKTLLTLRVSPINPSEEELAMFEGMHPSMQEGYGGTFDQLAQYLASRQ